jgi:hypothetical protein
MIVIRNKIVSEEEEEEKKKKLNLETVQGSSVIRVSKMTRERLSKRKKKKDKKINNKKFRNEKETRMEQLKQFSTLFKERRRKLYQKRLKKENWNSPSKNKS